MSEPVPQSPGATVTEAHVPYGCSLHKRSHHNEKPVCHSVSVATAHRNYRKARAAKKTQSCQKYIQL